MKVSIVMPCYNEEDKIENSVKSLLMQKPDELIVVDDCSKDKSREIVKAISGVKLIELDKNMGPAYARNIGWKSAIGDIIAFRDADSAVSKDFVSVVRNEFEKTNTDIIEFDVDPVVRESASLLEKSIFYKEASLGGNREFIALKSVLEKVGGFDSNLGFGEDRELASKLAKFKVVKSSRNYQVYISRVSGLREYLQRQLWYGRTMLAYLLKSKDKKVAISYLYSLTLLSSLFFSLILIGIPFFLLLCAILIFRTLRISYNIQKKYHFWQSFFILPSLEIIGRIFMGIGVVHGIILKLIGRYYVGR